MASPRHGARLPDSIPEDVRRRAEKAGVTRVDWYAGRLDTKPSSELTLGRTPSDRVEELRGVVRRQAETRSRDRGGELIRRLKSWVGGQRSGRARPAD